MKYDKNLDKYVDLKRANEEKQFYDNASEKCDVCGQSFEKHKYIVDCEIKNDPMERWGCLCAKCFAMVGKGIGWGSGQLYLRQTNGKWLMVTGFPPKENPEEV